MSTPIKAAATSSATAYDASPRTPQRGISSTFSSPGYRTEEDTVIFDIGTRYLRAGLANDSKPRCTVEYGPEQSRRCGDYRQWLPGYAERTHQVKHIDTWSRNYELWQLDTRHFDIGLMQDKIDRAIRTAFSKHLLMDAKGRKVMLVVPALTSHSVLSKLLTIFFHNFQIATVTLLSPPVMTVVGAGQRSGLVIDIGWNETTITAVYELREVLVLRSTRAMKALLTSVAKLLEGLLTHDLDSSTDSRQIGLDFHYVEEVTSQLIWCRSSAVNSREEALDADFSIQLPPPSTKSTNIRFFKLSQPIEDTLFARSIPWSEQDDEEHSIDHLLYGALARLDIDIRSICVSRIIFTGGGANIPGLKTRMLNDLGLTFHKKGWEFISLLAESLRDKRSQDVQPNTSLPAAQTKSGNAEVASTPAASEEPVHDIYGEHLKATLKPIRPQMHGKIRAIDSLGSFTGASLTAGLQVKGLVEIDGALFLQHGLMGPKRDQEAGGGRPKSFGGPMGRLPMHDNPAWILGAWA